MVRLRVFSANRVGGPQNLELTSPTTVRTDRYTAVHSHKCKDS